MYSPKIDERLIPRLYKLSKVKGTPMTVLVNDILRQAIERQGEDTDEHEQKSEGRSLR